ncbi:MULTISPECIES: DNA helicase PcrA [Exiguobacterium]|jgi:DNA helicase-2/ATP-dependent DNA helicase PcrA|uniref:ATP-dependent DNA helicase n=2 Tax=Exiguobacterium TaxID=33986 RepID=U1N3Z8_9BACL|nr:MULTISPECIES: DNA helicase PcrA [Exiguobacterium]ERG68606.1 ATP-dependent DNA helicase PcrA [Exiguobacterium chiriqhucha RW-2]MDL5377603.1 DNA helicase PcrA [Exiguobacterium mexicanum]TCI67037.1 DNA helicase PcrA [Exiguobacterium sp. IPCI3]TCI76369.1 DNA helicase PcrA [Exiguobacterium sp. IPCH1]TCI78146.1 DNA helicase PcrA [Exiguobacterium sp. IPBC4]
MYNLSEELVKGMNPPQAEAVKYTDGPLLIMAGAGSGKTRVLTHRVAYLMASKQIAPWNILAITFTNKAAREMKDRIARLVGGVADDIWISTFHSMCVRILRRDIDRIRYDRNFSILDSSDQLTAIKQVLKELNLDPKKYEPRTLLGMISNHKNELRTPQDAAALVGNNPYEKVISDVYTAYEKKLKQNNVLDFDDLIMKAIQLFQEAPDVLAFYQKKFQYIHVDEYQDTNRAQYTLVKLLAQAHENLCVVGDSDQSIYRWRGADIANILTFEKDYPSAHVILLEQNYRSTKRILEAANGVIQNNSGRKDKQLWTENVEGEKLLLHVASDDRDEAFFIINQMKELRQEGIDYGEMAVLYRTNAQSRGLEEMLLKSNIPYKMVGGTKFYERKEIKDILAYLRLIANPDEDISFVRVVNEPKRGIGAATVDKLGDFAGMQGVSLMEAIRDIELSGIAPRTATKLAEFRQLMVDLRQMADYLSISELIEEVLKKSGYEEMLKIEKTLEAESRLENLQEFLSVAQNFEKESDEQTLVAFLTDLTLVSDLDTLEEVDELHQVTLMTLHSAKGLEFPVVFLIGMEEGLFPHSRALNDPEEMEEERRLAYVGITRAEKRLYLTRAQSRMLYGRFQNNPESRFLHELPETLLERSGKAKKPMPWNPVESPGKLPVNGFSSKPKPKLAQSSGAESIGWNVGDKANHKKWGQGTVVQTRGEGDQLELDIAFPAVGIKRLLAKFAPIEKA